MFTVHLSLMDYVRIVVEASLYAALCGVLLYFSWQVITNPYPKPRPMWEKKEKP